MTTPKLTDEMLADAEHLAHWWRGDKSIRRIGPGPVALIDDYLPALLAEVRSSRASPSGRGEGEAAPYAAGEWCCEECSQIVDLDQAHVVCDSCADASAPGSGERVRALEEALAFINRHAAGQLAPGALWRPWDALDTIRRAAESALISSGPHLAAWYEADGSVSMLPAEEVERRRKAAAKVIGAAKLVSVLPFRRETPAEVDAFAALEAAVADLASPSSVDGGGK